MTKVVVACEYSGRVRQAFIDQGHEAWPDFKSRLSTMVSEK